MFEGIFAAHNLANDLPARPPADEAAPRNPRTSRYCGAWWQVRGPGGLSHVREGDNAA